MFTNSHLKSVSFSSSSRNPLNPSTFRVCTLCSPPYIITDMIYYTSQTADHSTKHTQHTVRSTRAIIHPFSSYRPQDITWYSIQGWRQCVSVCSVYGLLVAVTISQILADEQLISTGSSLVKSGQNDKLATCLIHITELKCEINQLLSKI